MWVETTSEGGLDPHVNPDKLSMWMQLIQIRYGLDPLLIQLMVRANGVFEVCFYKYTNVFYN